jgi:hypothetical protein
VLIRLDSSTRQSKSTSRILEGGERAVVWLSACAHCQAGIDRAKAKGTKFGRKPVLDAGKRKVLAERYAAGETMAKLALEYECGEATIWRALQG